MLIFDFIDNESKMKVYDATLKLIVYLKFPQLNEIFSIATFFVTVESKLKGSAPLRTRTRCMHTPASYYEYGPSEWETTSPIVSKLIGE